jgi:hypothetical protein
MRAMFGLKKEESKPIYEYDLEKELKDDKKQKILLDKAEKNVLEIKTLLRQGADQQEFEKLGILLHGYSALLKTLSNVISKK